MLIFDELFQVDKSDAVFLTLFLLLPKLTLLLTRQMKTETGSAGEQPVRDKFD